MNRKTIILSILIFSKIKNALNSKESESDNDFKKYDFRFYKMRIPSNAKFKMKKSNSSTLIKQYSYFDKRNNITIIIIPKKTKKYQVNNKDISEDWTLHKKINKYISIYIENKEDSSNYVALYDDDNIYSTIACDDLDKVLYMIKTIKIK